MNADGPDVRFLNVGNSRLCRPLDYVELKRGLPSYVLLARESVEQQVHIIQRPLQRQQLEDGYIRCASPTQNGLISRTERHLVVDVGTIG